MMNQEKAVSSNLVSLVWKFIVAYKKQTGEQLSYVDLINTPDQLEALALSFESTKNGELSGLARQIIKELETVPNDEDQQETAKRDQAYGNVISIKQKDWDASDGVDIQQPEDEIYYYAQLVEQFCNKGGVNYQDRLFLDHCLSQLKISDPQAIQAENKIRRSKGLPSLNWALEFHGTYSKFTASDRADESEIAKLYGVYGRPTRLSLDQIDHIVKQQRQQDKRSGYSAWPVKKLVSIGMALVFLLALGFTQFSRLPGYVGAQIGAGASQSVQLESQGQTQTTLNVTEPKNSLTISPPIRQFTIHGSNTVGAELGPKLVSRYFSKHHSGELQQTQLVENETRIMIHKADETLLVDIESHGSSTGFDALKSGSADIAAASRPIKDKEVALLGALGVGRSLASEHVLALDGVAIIVNVNNPLDKITKKQLRAIFSGEITNWKYLGGADQAIRVYARDAESGTFDTFRSLVLGNNTRLTDTAARYESNVELSSDVAKDFQGIGFVSLNSIGMSKALSVSDGSNPIFPTAFTVATEDYPLTRRLYFYTPYHKSAPVIDFLQYTLSDEGQAVVSSVGYVNLIPIVQRPYLPEGLPDGYLDLVHDKDRLSVSFRFVSGTNELDSRAYRDLDRVVRLMLQPEHRQKRLTLVGFSDNTGEYWSNVQLSEKRAISVANALTARGLIVEKVSGLGPLLPVAENSSVSGRYKNRRVEVWLSQ